MKVERTVASMGAALAESKDGLKVVLWVEEKVARMAVKSELQMVDC